MSSNLLAVYSILRVVAFSVDDEVPLTFRHFSLRQCLIERQSRSPSRFELSTMDDHEVSEYGMTRSSEKFKATKPFWPERRDG
jgi:uncharacterized protein YjiS (DUF1127 family)